VDFLILNIISKQFGIIAGVQLGVINVLAFIIAVIHNYIWQRHWTFSAVQDTRVMPNFIRLALAGILGVGTLAVVIIAAQFGAAAHVFLFILAMLLFFEVIFWAGFHLMQNAGQGQVSVQFFSFLIVSLVGLAINSLIIWGVSNYLVRLDLPVNDDLLKNMAKVAANAVSLVWNFIGYKVFVFKK
jgi:putative flippase GtrA